MAIRNSLGEFGKSVRESDVSCVTSQQEIGRHHRVPSVRPQTPWPLSQPRQELDAKQTMWPTTPKCVPKEWRQDGANALADAVGYGIKPGANAANADQQGVEAFVWYDPESDVKRTLSFSSAHKNACDVAALIRAAGITSGVLDTLVSDTPLICGLALCVAIDDDKHTDLLPSRARTLLLVRH